MNIAGKHDLSSGQDAVGESLRENGLSRGLGQAGTLCTIRDMCGPGVLMLQTPSKSRCAPSPKRMQSVGVHRPGTASGRSTGDVKWQQNWHKRT